MKIEPLTIWKYDLEIEDLQEIELPETNKILCVQTQMNRIRLWALVDPAANKVKIKIRIVGTGHLIDNDPQYQYLGTCQVDGGYVFHVFKVCDR